MQNAFVDAWVRTWQASGAQVAVLVSAPRGHANSVPLWLQQLTVYAPGDPRVAKEPITALLGGEPDTIFVWWGIGALAETRVKEAWPRARVLLSVDTFPNAAKILTELRERARGQLWAPRADALVVTSERMAVALARAVPALRRKPYVVVHSPFPAGAHGDGDPDASNNMRYCFTGRSDYFYTRNWRMAKDDLAPLLDPLIESGSIVAVQRPSNSAQATLLQSRGYRFYEPISRQGLLDGTFARMVSQFDAQLVLYNVVNPTLQRRVNTGLSTRFAVGLCSAAPLVVPQGSRFAADFFAKHQIGIELPSSPILLEQVLQERGSAMRQAWRNDHLEWAGEAHSAALADLAKG